MNKQDFSAVDGAVLLYAIEKDLHEQVVQIALDADHEGKLERYIELANLEHEIWQMAGHMYATAIFERNKNSFLQMPDGRLFHRVPNMIRTENEVPVRGTCG